MQLGGCGCTSTHGPPGDDAICMVDRPARTRPTAEHMVCARGLTLVCAHDESLTQPIARGCHAGSMSGAHNAADAVSTLVRAVLGVPARAVADVEHYIERFAAVLEHIDLCILQAKM